MKKATKPQPPRKDAHTCKWEPEYGSVSHGEFARASGKCRHPILNSLPLVPGCISMQEHYIVKYARDNSVEGCGVCKCWEAKENAE